jgi:hypothetical protein
MLNRDLSFEFFLAGSVIVVSSEAGVDVRFTIFRTETWIACRWICQSHPNFSAKFVTRNQRFGIWKIIPFEEISRTQYLFKYERYFPRVTFQRTLNVQRRAEAEVVIVAVFNTFFCADVYGVADGMGVMRWWTDASWRAIKGVAKLVPTSSAIFDPLSSEVTPSEWLKSFPMLPPKCTRSGLMI